MIITLDVFSGRPNPSWKLSSKDAKSFLERFAKKSVAGVNEVDNTLGYRGAIISAATDEQLPDNLPAEFRIGGNFSAEANANASQKPQLNAEEGDDAVRWLLSKGQHVVNEEVAAHVIDAIEMRRQGIAANHPTEMVEDITEKELSKPMAGCVIQNTPYNPGFWNVPSVQPYNNCYNYAMNCKSNTFAQPGRISGHPFSGAPTCANVLNAAIWDGLKTICTGPSKNVALVIWPGQDYHWYRRHSEGFWGHKPGQTAVRNFDNQTRIINGTTLTPFNCDRAPYTIFCGYYYSPVGMVVK